MTSKYSAQVLAIVFVLLIVGSIIGFALYARLIRESARIVDEQIASEANELAETVIGLMSLSDPEKLVGEEFLGNLGCDSETLNSDGCRKNNMDLSSLQEYFDALGIADADFSSFGEASCLTELALRYNSEGDEITIGQDYSYSVFVDNVDWSSCELAFSMSDNGDSDGFVLSRFYKDPASYKPYLFEDLTGYVYSHKLGEFQDPSNWKSYSSGSSLQFPLLTGSREASSLYEIRFKSLRGASNLSWSVGGDCDIDAYLIVEVGATCDGKYAGKIVNASIEVFAPPVFDYALFNGHGNLLPLISEDIE